MKLDSEPGERTQSERYRSWLRSIAEVAQAVFLLVDATGTLLDGVSYGSLQKRLGIEEITPGKPLALILPQLADSLLQSLAICRHTGHPQIVQHTLDEVKGVLLLKTVISRHHHNSYSIAIKDSHLERTLALKVESLSADQRQTIALLHEMDSRYRTLFDALSEGVIFASREGQILAANEAAAQIFRTSVAELSKLRLDEELPFEVLGEDLQPLPKERWPVFVTMGSGQPRQAEAMGIKFPSGDVVWLAVNSRPLWRAGESEPYSVVVSFFDISLRKQLEAELLHRAFHDPLTSLPNRSLFIDRLDTAIRQARRTGELVAVFFLDLDGFKVINDVHGHDVGDRFLQGVAHRLSQSLRDGDTVARFGGDEFTILLPSIVTTDDALRVAERVLEELQRPMLLAGHTLKAAASLGISLYPHDGQESAALLRNADQAMYRVKSSGRNGCQFFRPEMNVNLIRTPTREESLHQELAQGALKLRYRPLMDLASEQVVAWAVELFRPGANVSSEDRPSQVAVSDETAPLVLQVILERACQDLLKLGSRKPIPPLVVRLDGRHLVGNTALKTVASVLEKTGIAAQLIELDVLAPGSSVDWTLVGESLWQLHRLGVRIGMSASPSTTVPLLQLSQLPLSSVALPEPLWRRCLEDSRTLSACEGLVALADRLGYIVSAGGLRTQAERRLVHKLGCQRGHGLLWPARSELNEPI